MKRIVKICLIAFSASWGIGAIAQTPTYSDVLKLSQYNYSFGSARSAAMGGAFTSLGADLSAMSINPAGLGMYLSSEVGVSPTVTVGNVNSHFLGYGSSEESRSRFTVGNVAAAFNVYQGGGSVTSITLGIGYNKLADFNNNSSVSMNGNHDNMAEFLAERLYGVSDKRYPSDPTEFNIRNWYQSLYLDQWGAGLAYQNGILNPVDGYDNLYTPYGYPLSNNETLSSNPSMNTYSTGSIGEYDISMGMNIKNILYLGMTLGIQDVYYRTENSYVESYNNNQGELQNMHYVRTQRLSGAGFNVKFGAIVRPVKNLRIGVAIHTPTYINLDHSYREGMSSRYVGELSQGPYYTTPEAVNSYKVNTPTRLLTGISYAFPGVGLISFDYERAWYNGMRLRNTDFGGLEEAFKDDVKTHFQAGNNLRAGLELTPTRNFFIRGGYAYYGDAVKTKDYMFFTSRNGNVIDFTTLYPDIDSYQNYSGGIGYRWNRAYVDLTYVHTAYKYIDSPLYYFYEAYTNDQGLPEEFWLETKDVRTKQKRHTVILSFGVRF